MAPFLHLDGQKILKKDTMAGDRDGNFFHLFVSSYFMRPISIGFDRFCGVVESGKEVDWKFPFLFCHHTFLTSNVATLGEDYDFLNVQSCKDRSTAHLKEAVKILESEIEEWKYSSVNLPTAAHPFLIYYHTSYDVSASFPGDLQQKYREAFRTTWSFHQRIVWKAASEEEQVRTMGNSNALGGES